MARLTVIGGSHGIGLETVKEAVSRGHDVTAFARSASSMGFSHDALRRIDGDALVPGDVERAISGAEIVVQALGVPFDTRLLTGPVTLFSETTGLLISALKKAGVRRLIAITGYGAGDSESSINRFQRLPFNLVFGRAYRDKSIQERLIKESELEWTIVRPGVLTNGPKTERYEVITDLNRMKNGLISRADVAHFLVDQIDSDQYIREAPVLRGGMF